MPEPETPETPDMELADVHTHDGDTMALPRSGNGHPPALDAEPLAPHAAAPPAGGTGALDRYEIIGKLASGGMGIIYETRDLHCQRPVAMKVLQVRQLTDCASIIRFTEEAQITAQLEHPNVIPVHDAGEDSSGRAFYTMKLVHGVTLKAILDGVAAGTPELVAKYPLNHLLTVFLKTCDAVAFAHSRGVIHRDLKPANIMVGEFGEVLVMDWGLAKVFKKRESPAAGVISNVQDEELRKTWQTLVISARTESGDDALLTMEGEAVGTPAYMSPEQARGKITELDERTDIYALGGILYSILTLLPPVSGRKAKEVMREVVNGSIVPPSCVCHGRRTEPAPAADPAAGDLGDKRPAENHPAADPGLGRPERPATLPHLPGGRVPFALSAVAMKALAYKPEKRYSSVQELQAEIESHRNGFATRAEAAGLLRHLLLLIKRHKTVVFTATTAILLLAGMAANLVATITWERRDALAARSNAENYARRLLVTEKKLADMGIEAAPEFVDKAKRLMANHEWEQAMTAAAKAVKLDERLTDAWFILGLLHLADLRCEAAQDAFGRVHAASHVAPELSRRATELQKLSCTTSLYLGTHDGKADKTLLDQLAADLQRLQEPLLAARLAAQAATCGARQSTGP